MTQPSLKQEYNTITDSQIDVKGNFSQDTMQIFLGGNFPEMFTRSPESIRQAYEANKYAETIKKIEEMTIEQLAKELIYHVLNHIRQSEVAQTTNKLIEFEDPLLKWIKHIFYDESEQIKPTFISIHENSHHIYHRKRVLIDVEEFLYYNNKKIKEFRSDLIHLETK
jgi:phage/plasmid-associated DNA primase